MESFKKLEIPKAKRYVILGKGPSLDGYRPRDGDYLIGLNEAAMHFPVKMCVANDSNIIKRLNLNSEIIKVSPQHNCHLWNSNSYYVEWEGIDPSGNLFELFTAGIALSILGYMGIKHNILLVGFDGYDYVDPQKKIYSKKVTSDRPHKNYDKVNQQINKVISHYNLKLKFFHRKPIRYISAYTVETSYAEQIKNLIDSFQELKLPYQIYPYECSGSWVLNCGQKPHIIYQAIHEYEGPIVWIDADAIVRKDPSIFREIVNTCDFAYHKIRNAHLGSGTLFFNYTKESIKLLTQWKEGCKARSHDWDQGVLESFLRPPSRSLRICRLPPAYCFIYDLSRQFHPGTEPIIEHFQHSRVVKNIIPHQGYLKKRAKKRHS